MANIIHRLQRTARNSRGCWRPYLNFRSKPHGLPTDCPPAGQASGKVPEASAYIGLCGIRRRQNRRCMSNPIQDLIEQSRLTARAVLDFGSHLFDPTIRLGVTGLSGAGKTVFITALVHSLVRGGRFPVFEALANGRIADARLSPQPDDDVPRFAYEDHLRALIEERRWPESTRRISELRLAIDYQSHGGAMRTLTLDIVDYPGEWLLDLPLLSKSYAQWSTESLALSRQYPRKAIATQWHRFLKTLDPLAPEDEQTALTAAKLFTDYLQACRDQRYAMSMVPPGRFLMPGELAGSPALTFAPLDLPKGQSAPRHSVWAMMERRYEAYKNIVVRPFFRDHFARLDRQIVLVDLLTALNAGPEALHDLEGALASILECFRAGRKNMFNALFRPRIDRILFAATKADHLHRTSHDRLEAILRRLTDRAAGTAEFAGAQVDVAALAALRATREGNVRHGRAQLPSILGVPAEGESAGGKTFDGETEAAMFPGDLPDDPEALFNGNEKTFRGLTATSAQDADFRFLRLRPPLLQAKDPAKSPVLPQIRLDRALQFLIGDRLQ
jgi:predicted YcjX-like family ATPase